MQSSRTTGSRFINIRFNAEPPSIHIEEGGAIFASGDPPTFNVDNAAQKTFSTNLPIDKWKSLQPVDILVTCSHTDFKIYLNGELIKSINYWHDFSDPVQPFPTLKKLGWKALNNAKFSKISWTYGKSILSTTLFVIYI